MCDATSFSIWKIFCRYAGHLRCDCMSWANNKHYSTSLYRFLSTGEYDLVEERDSQV